MIGKFFACGCLAASLFAIGPVARAGETNTPVQNPGSQFQRRPARQENLNGGRGPLGFPGAAITSPVAVLTPEQRTSFQTALRAERGRMLELDGKLRTARHEMDEASVTGTFNETLVREKALAAARIEAEMAVIRAKCISKVQPPLSPEQIEKIKNNIPTPINPSLERPAQTPRPGSTNHDENGLPPKQ